MKSHELAKLLLEKPDVELIMQKDSEGNGYKPICGIDFNVLYVPDTTWDGGVYNLDWTADECCLDEDEWETMKKNNPGYAVLYPFN